MKEQAINILDSLRELEKQISDPEVIADQKRYLELLRKHKAMKSAVSLAEEYMGVLNDLEEYRQVLRLKEDAELVEMAQEEVPLLKEEEARLAAQSAARRGSGW